MEKSYKNYTTIFKALSDETRLKIVEMLSCGEMCACDILEFFNITQPTLSYHMKILTDCGILITRKDGSWIRYTVNKEEMIEIKALWDCITTGQPDCVCYNFKMDTKCE